VIVTDNPETLESLRARMLARLLAEIDEEEKAPEARIRPINQAKKWYWAAAAAVIGITIGGYFFFNRSNVVPVETLAREARFKNDLPAGGNHAILQLADGRQLTLDSAAKGILALQGGSQVSMNADGGISYQAKTKAGEVVNNTISTPAGGQFSLLLADGSKIWLNAETNLSFPAAFPGKERRVELSGEAYFEVAKNPSQPFIVAIGKAGTDHYREVEVLGTHFNVKAYADEAAVKTTLLEGKVLVSVPSTKESQTLAPGQEVSIETNGKLDFNSKADVDEAVAWQHGLFRFKNEPIGHIMEYAKRWYGIDVVYQGSIADLFVTTIPRQSTLQQFLTILETTGRVRFMIEGKKVTVIPVK